MSKVESRFIVETNEGLIDVSGCHIKIETRGPVMPYDNFSEVHNLVAKDFRIDNNTIIAQFKNKKFAQSAYEKIKSAMRINESYVDITNCESDDQNAEDT